MKIRNIIRSAATALTAALILPFAVSCGNTTAADTTAGSQTEPPPEKKSYTVIENGTSNYSIKAGRMVTQLCTSSLELMQNAFRAVYGTSPATDGTAPFIELAIEGGRRDCCIEFDEETGNIRITGGRAAEEIAVGTVTTGASNDIEQATKLARAMITRFGMDDDFGMVAFETVTNQYLGGDTSLSCSAETQSKIDERVVSLVKKQYEKAKAILVENKKKLDELAQFLYENETITGEQFMSILENKE